MSRYRQAALACAALLLGLGGASGASAHHVWSSQFDACAPVALTGRVVRVEWINPHAVIHVTGVDADGRARTYAFVTGTPNGLLRAGLGRAVLAEGAEVTVHAFLAKAGDCGESRGETGCRAAGALLTPADGVTRAISPGGGAPTLLPAAWPKPQRPAGEGFRAIGGERAASCEATPGRAG